MNHTAGLDFIGIARLPLSTPFYLFATLALLMVAYFGRRSKVASA